MTDDSDVAQARVFLAALDREIDAVSLELEQVRRFVAISSEQGNDTSEIRHREKMQEHKKVLRELHRQSENLRLRFSLT
ncbi:hypothetical protein [Rhodococcoides trifolii]|uniref:hypothetical protein n=1 Tax=Rhodococcoides trifolii TaxID=908250 RepID=UPI00166421FE|nr:hypothetical protein [Rhodococcus trifolii]